MKKARLPSTSLMSYLRGTIEEECDENTPPDTETDEVKEFDEINDNNSKTSVFKRKQTRYQQQPSRESDLKRRTAFMDNNLKRNLELEVAINAEMEKTIQEISFSKYR